MKSKKEKAPKPKYNMWQCSAYMISLAWREKEKKVIFLCLLQVILGVSSNLVNLYVSPSILSAVERHAPMSVLITTVWFFVLLIMLCSASNSYVSSNTMYGRISVRMALMGFLNKKSGTTSYPNITDEKFIEMRSKSQWAVNDNGQATEAVWGTLVSLMKNCIGFVIYVFLLMSLDVWLILVISVTSLIGYFVNKRLYGYEYRHRDELGKINSKLWYHIGLVKNITVAKDIRIFGMKPWLKELADKAMNVYIAFQRRANNVYIWGNILGLVLTFLRNGLAYFVIINMVLTDGLTVSEFLLYFSAVGGFTAWVSGILGDLTTLHRQGLDISTIREFLEYHEPFKFEDGEGLSTSADSRHELRLENVSFKYPGAEEYTLENINLTIRPGEKIAVVGLNGAGKTTLVKLICGFYDPTDGRVMLDGRDIRAYNRREYYAMFSAVFQNFSLLAGTVAANVAQTEEGIDMERVRDCVEKAGLTSKITSLKNGYETYLNRSVYENGAELSGGETQKLMLARALYKDAPFIILDEPTAALDPIAESKMYNKYDELSKGRTSLYISHRLASTRFCDRILLISNHKIAEEGTHSELLRLSGEYANLFNIQSKYYREGNDDEKGKEAYGLA